MDNKTDKDIINTKNETTSFVDTIKNKIVKEKVDYFQMFVEGADISLEAAEALKVAFQDEIIHKESLKLVKEIEHKGDKHRHNSLAIIETAFITPIDQTDIIDVLEGIENLTDSINDIAIHLNMMRVEKRDEFMMSFTQVIVLACEKIYDLMVAFKQFKKNPDNIINNLVVDINALEEEGDKIYSQSMSDLFGAETDFLNIIKKKEIYQLLENSLDCCEEVADLVERIMLTE